MKSAEVDIVSNFIKDEVEIFSDVDVEVDVDADIVDDK